MLATAVRPYQSLLTLLFNNYVGLLPNIIYSLYHSYCKSKWKLAGNILLLDSDTRQFEVAVDSLKHNGYCVLAPQVNGEIIGRISGKVADLIKRPEKTFTPGGLGSLATTLKEAFGDVPEIVDLLTPNLVRLVEQYFGSYMKIYYATIYRSHPTDQVPRVSWLWHSDIVPSQILKIMVYLTDTKKDNGALRVIPWERTVLLKRRGFRDRNEADGFLSELEEGHSAIEGKAGTVVIFNPNVIHKATIPLEGYRDVVVFMVLPSPQPWQECLQKNMGQYDLNARKLVDYPFFPFTA